MAKNFGYWKKQHDSDSLNEFNQDVAGTLWLKTKSVIRRDILDEFLGASRIELKSTSLVEQFRELFEKLSENMEQAHKSLNDFIKDKNHTSLQALDMKVLINELYKVESFKWGADNQNDLGKYLVKKYIKDNSSYDYLISNVETNVLKTVQDYLVCSWYNHWSSILIEYIFKSHDIVLPTVGQIKSVDFFINEIPFDLKVTYLPTNFIEEERKKAGLKPELTALKQAARVSKITFDIEAANLYYILSERLKDNGSSVAVAALKEIKDFRLNLIDRIKSNPLLLAKNLYERQSDFRFGAENRIFLILIDTQNFEDSWKLKRNVDLLQPKIHSYLSNFSKKDISSLKLEFYKEGNQAKNSQKYEVLTDIIVVEK